MTRQAYIYALIDPNTEQVRYIGQSTNPRQRFLVHMAPNNRASSKRVREWLRSLKEIGALPILKVLGCFDLDSITEQEQLHIARHASDALLNQRVAYSATRTATKPRTFEVPAELPAIIPPVIMPSGIHAFLSEVGAKGGAKSKRNLSTEEARGMAQKSALKRRAKAEKKKGN